MIGFGSLPRKEDARFIRGQGRYLDDVHPSGLLHGAIHTSAQISGKAASMGEGIVQTVLDALITDFTQKLKQI